jgi:sarcosine oxidase gamma subunit
MARDKTRKMTPARKAVLRRNRRRAAKKAALTKKRGKIARKAVATRKKRALRAAAGKAWKSKKKNVETVADQSETAINPIPEQS